jgi:electron transfer flavoprotein alpha subunit
VYYNRGQRNITIVAEHKNGEIDALTLKLAGKGRAIADKWNCPLNAVLLGNRIENPANQLLDKGFDTVFVADYSFLEPYNAEIYTGLISELFKDQVPTLILMGYTYLGMELGPAVASRLGIPLVSNCVGVELTDEGLAITRILFSSTMRTRLEAKQFPLVISIQRGALPENVPSKQCTQLKPINAKIDPSAIKTRVLDVIQRVTHGIDITKADILISVGRGIGSKAGIDIAQKLAVALNGTLSCSRPIADLGWLPPECQVGISGLTVRPKIYLALGISGSSQHLDGMRDSQIIIAINNDPSAPIFQVAHYGVIGDVHEIIPAMLE